MEETKRKYDETLTWLKRQNRNIEPEVIEQLVSNCNLVDESKVCENHTNCCGANGADELVPSSVTRETVQPDLSASLVPEWPTPRSLTQRFYEDMMMPVGAGDDMQKVRVSMELPKDWGKVV